MEGVQNYEGFVYLSVLSKWALVYLVREPQ